MSFGVTDLDEYTSSQLRTELKIREERENRGECVYCGRPRNAVPVCKFPRRHDGTQR